MFLPMCACFLKGLEVRSYGQFGAIAIIWFYSSSPPQKALLWDTTVSQYFLWISSRNPKLKFSWLDWLQNPVMYIFHVISFLAFASSL